MTAIRFTTDRGPEVVELRGPTYYYETISDDPVIQERYEQMRRDGQSHLLAEMLACQKPPRGKDNTSWLAANSKAIGGGDLAPPVRQHHEAMAREAGVSIDGKVYMPALARKNMPGDPRAWVTDHSEFKRRLEERGDGWSDGTQSVKARDDFAPTPDIEVAPDLVEERACQMIESNPDLLHKHVKLTPKGDDVTISGELLHEAKESCKSNSER